MHESSEVDLPSRRGLLSRGLALAAILAGLGARTAWAGDDDHDDDDDDDHRGRNDNDRRDVQRVLRPRAERLNAFSSDICRIVDVTADFSSGNAGTDSLVDGRIRLRNRRNRRNGPDDARVHVTLRGRGCRRPLRGISAAVPGG